MPHLYKQPCNLQVARLHADHIKEMGRQNVLSDAGLSFADQDPLSSDSELEDLVTRESWI